MKKVTLVLVVMLIVAAGAQAAFIVEPHSSGKANANFSGVGKASISSTAIGLTATNSIFSGTGASGSTADFVFSYTPGVDMDNTTLAAGTDLGNGDLASGLTGGLTGRYNVYITWPASTNVNVAGCKITVTNDGADVVLDPVNMNTDGTGTPGGNNGWYKIADNIQLTAGVTYTITQHANAWTWTSMRSAGVMWEQVPEPTTLLLLGAGALAIRKFRKA